jgi:hypothetical protein
VKNPIGYSDRAGFYRRRGIMKTQKFSKPSVFLILIFSFVALTCNSTAGLPNPFATGTPSPTTTPTSTPSPTPTLTPTITPTPLPTGSLKKVQSDGTTLFTDYDNKYEIVFPSGWTAISLTTDDLNNLLDLASKNNPGLENTITALKGLDPNVFRIFVFDFRSEHMVNGYPASINIAAQSNTVMNGMSLQNIVDQTEQSLPQIYKGIKVLSSKVTKTGSNIPIGVIEMNLSFATGTGSKVPVYEQLVILKMPEVVVTVTLAVPTSKKAILVPEFKVVIDSIKLLE